MKPITRRGFLALLGLGGGAIALDAAIPLNRVWFFPKQIVIAQPANVRFMKAWDMEQGRFVGRFDAMYGFTPELPHRVHTCEQIRILREDQMQTAIDILAKKYGAISVPAEVLKPRYPREIPQQSYASTQLKERETEMKWVRDFRDGQYREIEVPRALPFRLSGYRKASASIA